jgi:hypothetical protein
MAETEPTGNIRLTRKPPSFGMVVAMAAVVLIIILIAAYFVIGGAGKTLMPGSQPRNAEPTSQLVLPIQHNVQRNA